LSWDVGRLLDGFICADFWHGRPHSGQQDAGNLQMRPKRFKMADESTKHWIYRKAAKVAEGRRENTQ
jgi:hypothetical protein